MNKNQQEFTNFISHLKLEAVALAILMIALAYKSDYSAWWLLIGFPFVDVCMFGYMASPKAGALMYNLAHNATFPTLLISVGVITGNGFLSIIGFVWTFHSAVDRVLGYGLKHKHSFNETHLGPIKK